MAWQAQVGGDGGCCRKAEAWNLLLRWNLLGFPSKHPPLCQLGLWSDEFMVGASTDKRLHKAKRDGFE